MRLITALVMGAASLLSVAANAAVVFENGTNGNFWGGNNPFTYQLVTNGFSLAQDSVLTSLTYNAFTTASTVPVSNVLVNLYQNSAGSLGSLLFSQNLTISDVQLTGYLAGYELTDYSINLPNLALTAGNYFLGLQVSPSQWDMHWSLVSNPAATGQQGSDGYAHYFRLESNLATNIPEPSSLLLLSLGLLSLGTASWRKRR